MLSSEVVLMKTTSTLLGEEQMDKNEFSAALRTTLSQVKTSDPDVLKAAVLVENIAEMLSIGLVFSEWNIEGIRILGHSDIVWKECPIRLTAGEFRVMKCLWNSLGAYMTYRALFMAMHNGVFFHSGNERNGLKNNVRSSIKRIRMKFKRADPDFDMIQARATIGYCWGKIESNKIALTA